MKADVPNEPPIKTHSECLLYARKRPFRAEEKHENDGQLSATSGHPNFVELPAMVSGDFFFSKSQKAGGIVVQNVALLLVSEK